MLRFRGAFVVAVLLLGVVPQGLASMVSIYGSNASNAGNFVNRATSLGYATAHWTTSAQVNQSSLEGTDVLFVQTGSAWELAAKASLIADWVSQGGGLIVEQPNQSGPVAILPPGLDITIWDWHYDGSHSGPDPVRNVLITARGASHPITFGLTTADVCQNADRVLRSDVSAAYDILGVQVTNTDYVAVAAATYGEGRVVFHTGNTSPDAMTPGSDQYIRQMIDWAAVPEPTTLLLLVASGLLVTRRRP
jgi:hypothetical protein